MKMLEDRIRADGIVREGDVLKVDSFINHQMDIPLFREMARHLRTFPVFGQALPAFFGYFHGGKA